MKIYNVIFLLFLSLLLSACFNTASSSDQQQSNKVPALRDMLKTELKQDGRACIRQSHINGYGSGPNNILYVDAQPHGYFVVDLRFCFGSQLSVFTAFEGRFSQVCGGRADKAWSNGGSCQIRHIFQFDDREQAHDAVKQIKQKRADLLEQEKTLSQSDEN